MRRAFARHLLAGAVQHYGMALRWEGAVGGPPLRSYTEAEERELIPYMARVAANIVEQGLVAIHERSSVSSEPGPALTGAKLYSALAEPSTWLIRSNHQRILSLGATEIARRGLFAQANIAASLPGIPTWDELSVQQRKVLVCAAEASGMLTGPFGIWDDPPETLSNPDILVWVERQADPLIPFMRNGWVEVQHFAAVDDYSFRVIPPEGLYPALSDSSLRYSGDEFGVGFTCIFTDAGRAVWNSNWSHAWNAVLRFE